MACPLQNERLIQLYSQPTSDTSFPEEDACDLQKYLHVGHQQTQQEVEEQQGKNDYCFELSELRERLMSIELISQGEISRLKKELQQSRERGREAVRAGINTVSVGVNTEPDHRDEEIMVLREMLKQQSLVNKQLLRQTLRDDGPFQGIIQPGIRVSRN